MISEELNELRQDLKQLKAEILQFERDLAWNRVIDKAIIVCRLLRKLEMAEAVKFNPNWHLQPRVPKLQDGAGRWARGGGGNDVHLVADRQSPSGGADGHYLKPYVEPTTPVLVGSTTLQKVGANQIFAAAKDGDVFMFVAVTPGAGQSGPQRTIIPGLPSGVGYFIWTWSDTSAAFKTPPDVRVASGTILVGTYAKSKNSKVTISGLNSYYGRVLRFNFAPDETTPSNTTVRVYKMPKAKR